MSLSWDDGGISLLGAVAATQDGRLHMLTTHIETKSIGILPIGYIGSLIEDITEALP